MLVESIRFDCTLHKKCILAYCIITLKKIVLECIWVCPTCCCHITFLVSLSVLNWLVDLSDSQITYGVLHFPTSDWLIHAIHIQRLKFNWMWLFIGYIHPLEQIVHSDWLLKSIAPHGLLEQSWWKNCYQSMLSAYVCIY